MRKTVLWATLALAVVLILPGEGWAQRRAGRGGYRGGSYSPGWYSDSGYYRDGAGITIYGVPFTGSRNYPSSYSRSYYYGPAEEYTVPADVTSNIAYFEVRVPADAEIWFGNSKTEQTGPVRHFDSPELERGKTFTYDVRARWMGADGKMVEKTKHVKVQPGARIGVDFNKQ